MIVNEKWPETQHVDDSLVLQNEFLHRSVREFRLRRDARLGVKKKSGTKALLPPENANIYIARCYPQWKSLIIRKLRELWQVGWRTAPFIGLKRNYLNRKMTKDSLKIGISFTT